MVVVEESEGIYDVGETREAAHEKVDGMVDEMVDEMVGQLGGQSVDGVSEMELELGRTGLEEAALGAEGPYAASDDYAAKE